MKNWEYAIGDGGIIDAYFSKGKFDDFEEEFLYNLKRLNELGEKGWEVTGILQNKNQVRYLMKREKNPD